MKLAKRISSILSDQYSADCAEDQDALNLSAAARLISNNGIITHHLDDGRSVRHQRQFLGRLRLELSAIFYDRRACRHAAGLKAHARHNYGAASALHRLAINNLRQHIYKCGLSDDLPELEEMSLSELRERYGATERNGISRRLQQRRTAMTFGL